MSRSILRLAFLVICGVLATSALSGCGEDDESKAGEPKTFKPDVALGEAKSVYVKMDRPLDEREQQIVESLAGFVDSVHDGEWKVVCDDYFTPKAQAQYGGPKKCAANMAKFAKDFEGLTMHVLGFQHVQAGSRIAVNSQSRATPVLHKEFYDSAPSADQAGRWKFQPIPPPKTGLGG